MRRLRSVAVFLGMFLGLGVVAPAEAGDFSPTVKFSLSSTKVKANPKVSVVVAQDPGEESIKSVEFDLPAGFKLPTDSKIQDGELIGSGTIDVALTFFGCNENLQLHADARINERDRTQQEISDGVKAVWVVDLAEGMIQIDLKIYGSTKTGWQLKGDVPENDATCPPFTVKVAINKKSSETQTPIWRNPSVAKKYQLRGVFQSTEGSTKTVTQRVKIHS